jgi:hypothetical protein
MLCATFLMILYLGFKLGVSSEYRDFAPGADEQLAQTISVQGKVADEPRDSRELPLEASKAADQPYGEK